LFDVQVDVAQDVKTVAVPFVDLIENDDVFGGVIGGAHWLLPD
jgi:hypothetical protein